MTTNRHNALICGRASCIAASILAFTAATAPSHAEMPAVTGDGLITIASLGPALPDAQLDALRGGFDAGDGLRFAFSFDRVTRLNGEALSQVTVILPAFNLIGGHTSRAFDSTSQHLAGMDALSSTGISSGAIATAGLPVLIQNALDNQHIENLTLINLDIFGTDALRGGMIHNLIETTSIQSLTP